RCGRARPSISTPERSWGERSHALDRVDAEQRQTLVELPADEVRERETGATRLRGLGVEHFALLIKAIEGPSELVEVIAQQVRLRGVGGAVDDVGEAREPEGEGALR